MPQVYPDLEIGALTNRELALLRRLRFADNICSRASILLEVNYSVQDKAASPFRAFVYASVGVKL